MKKVLILAGMLSLLGGMSFAAPSPEFLEDLTTQILEQQTLKKSWKEVLDQLKSLFAQCAILHTDQALQSVCKNFLEKQFTSLEKKWSSVLKGGIRLTSLGKLSASDRLAHFGLQGYKASFSSPYKGLGTGDLEYYVLQLQNLPFSFLIPQTPKEQIDEMLYQDFFDCEREVQRQKNLLANEKIISPQTFESEEEKKLQNTFCHQSLKIQHSPSDPTTFTISAPLNVALGNMPQITIKKRKLWSGETLEALAQQECLSWRIASELSFDQTGNAYYQLDIPYTKEVILPVLPQLQLGLPSTSLTSFSKPIGLGKNLQTMLKESKAQNLTCHGTIYLQLQQDKEELYQISFSQEALLLGYYFGLDLNNPDGSSSFLSK